MENKILIEDILLKMNYDLSKTLTENKEFINEQKTYYYDSNGNLKTLDGPYAIPQGGTPASKVYPNLKPGEYPNSTYLTGVKTKPVQRQLTPLPSDYLGPGGGFQQQFPEYDPKQQAILSKTVRVSPSEYTKKLNEEQYQEFFKERNRIVKLPPSFKATEYNKKYSEALSEFQNYNKKYDDYYSAEKRYLNQLEYITALYYPEKWTSNLKKPFDAHDGLLLVAVGVFAIPLLLAAAGASTVVVSGAFLGAQIVSTSADVADALLYLNEGNLEMAGLSAIFAVLPFVPNLARYSKELIESAVKKYSKGTALDKVESDIVTQLTKKETKEQITKAAEQEASKKLTPDISKSVSQGIATVKNMVSKGANITTKAMNTTIGGVATTLVGFYVVGQTYQDAVESYKKSQLSPFQIYEKLLSQKKISLSWNDLKWVFGSDGSVSDNQKLGTALLSGYNGENSNEWLYKNTDFRTKTWTNKWLPIYQEELNKQKYQTDVLTSLSKNNSSENRQKAKQLQKEKILTDENGEKRTEDDFKKIADEILSDKNLFDISKPFKQN